MTSILDLTASIANPHTLKQLNLSSTSLYKIHAIEHLQHFARLRSLILSNNMIRRMGGLEKLKNLRLLNLQFNQIAIVEGTEKLEFLEELYLSYNEIEIVGESIRSNKRLRVLHLAYNDISSLQDIAVLYAPEGQGEADNLTNRTRDKNSLVLPQLQALSLYGNPIVVSLNYLSFFKMLIPTLRRIDDKNVYEDDLLTHHVYPQQEVLILRQALNELMDERNHIVDQLSSYMGATTAKNEDRRLDSVHKTKVDEGYRKERMDHVARRNKIKKQIFEMLTNCREKIEKELEQSKNRAAHLSQLYTQRIKNQKTTKAQEISMLLDPPQNSKPSENHPQSQDYFHETDPPKNGQILAELKEEEQRSKNIQSKLRNLSKFEKLASETLSYNPEADLLGLILEVTLLGFQGRQNITLPDYFKLCKKFIFKSFTQSKDQNEGGLIQYNQVLKSIVYGDKEDRIRINYQLDAALQLKDRLKGKGLLEIITELKQNSINEGLKYSKYESERQAFVAKFETETEELAQAWEQLQKQREKFMRQRQQHIANKQQEGSKRQQQMKRKYKITEQEEKQKIVDLKCARDRLEAQVHKLEATLAETEDQLNRKFIELQQFEAHFNQFIQQKQHIKSLEGELNQLETAVRQQTHKYEKVQTKVKEMCLQEGILENKLKKLNQLITEKRNDLAQMDEARLDKQKENQRLKQQNERERDRLRQTISSCASKNEQIKDLQKMAERNKKNYSLLEQKIKNIQHMQSNKKSIIKQLQQQIKGLKEDKASIQALVENTDKVLEGKREELARLQVKLQQNKMVTENLADLTKNINEMMIRQSELKRSIIELEIENRNLVEMRNNLMEDFRMKRYV